MYAFLVTHPLEHIQKLQKSPETRKSTLRIGIAMIEGNNVFWQIKDRKSHLYHYLENFLWAYTELNAIGKVVAAHDTLTANFTNIQQNQPVLQVPWVHAPPLLRSELLGSNHINQVLTQLIMGPQVELKGMESNDHIIQALHPSYRGNLPCSPLNTAWERQRKAEIPPAEVRQHNWQRLAQTVDAVLFVSRLKCHHI